MKKKVKLHSLLIIHDLYRQPKLIVKLIMVCTLLTLFTGCKKFLETKSVQTLATPESLVELQGLLDNPNLTAGPTFHNTASDEYFMPYNQYLTRPEIARKTYIWDANLDTYTEWGVLYNTIYYANNVLFNLDFIEGSQEEKRSIKGQALFLRSHSFFLLLQLFAPQYDPTTADTDLGIVLRLNADFNEMSVRSSVRKCYQQTIADLEEAATLLPNTLLNKNRPNKAACYGLLARVYLQIGDYSKALTNARECQTLYNTLIDYNSFTVPYPMFPLPNLNNNSEILFYYTSANPLNANHVRSRVDSNLVSQYSNDDIRKGLFFIQNPDQTYIFRGQYTGESLVLFTGVATDEVLLISAECEARRNRPNEALADLNRLLVNRYKSGTFVPFQNLNASQVLNIVLMERRKQLLNRGIRWSDLKRLNKESQFAITIRRNLNGTIYELPPNDKRYVFLIPLEVINLTGMPQNPR